MKVLDTAIWVLCGLLCALGLVVAIDLVSAIGAQACPGTADCYPWGAEGPASEHWQYSSKEVYIASGAAKIVLPLAALGVMVVSSNTRTGFHRVMVLVGASAALLLNLA